jgi:hypothetical protein
MREDLRTRVVVLVGLVAVGATLGVAGATAGVGGPVATDDPAATFVVSADNVSVAAGGERASVVDDVAAYEAVQIEAVGDGFHVSTAADHPLSAHQRERARATARENDSVRERLASLRDAELVVEPVVLLESAQYDVSGTVNLNDEMNVTSNGSATVRVKNYTVTERDDGVTVESEDSYADDLAVVEVRRPGSEEGVLQAHVDLENETVTGVSD